MPLQRDGPAYAPLPLAMPRDPRGIGDTVEGDGAGRGLEKSASLREAAPPSESRSGPIDLAGANAAPAELGAAREARAAAALARLVCSVSTRDRVGPGTASGSEVRPTLSTAACSAVSAPAWAPSSAVNETLRADVDADRSAWLCIRPRARAMALERRRSLGESTGTALWLLGCGATRPPLALLSAPGRSEAGKTLWALWSVANWPVAGRCCRHRGAAASAPVAVLPALPETPRSSASAPRKASSSVCPARESRPPDTGGACASAAGATSPRAANSLPRAWPSRRGLAERLPGDAVAVERRRKSFMTSSLIRCMRARLSSACKLCHALAAAGSDRTASPAMPGDAASLAAREDVRMTALMALGSPRRSAASRNPGAMAQDSMGRDTRELYASLTAAAEGRLPTRSAALRYADTPWGDWALPKPASW